MQKIANVRIMKIRKYFLFQIMSLVKTNVPRMYVLSAVWSTVELYFTWELGSKVKASMRTAYIKVPLKILCIIHYSISLMRAKVGEKYVFLNPRIYPVQWYMCAYMRRMPEEPEGIADSQLHFSLFWGTGSLSGTGSEIYYTYITNDFSLCQKAITHILKGKKVKRHKTLFARHSDRDF